MISQVEEALMSDEFDRDAESETEESETPSGVENQPEAVVEAASASAAPPVDPNLKPADADADADLARPPRASLYRVQRRTQASMIAPAFLMIAVGLLYLSQIVSPDVTGLSTPLLIGLGIGALGLGLMARFVLNGRRERGLFIAGLVILAWTGLAALVASGNMPIEQSWPLGVIAVGLAMLATFFFERNHERGLILPALAFMAAGSAAMPFALGMIPTDLSKVVAIFWPLLILIPALALLPSAARPRGE
jgi:hypothetical protein